MKIFYKLILKLRTGVTNKTAHDAPVMNLNPDKFNSLVGNYNVSIRTMGRMAIAAFLISMYSQMAVAQTDGVQIDYSVTPPARSNAAILELNSSAQGFVVPRMALTSSASPISGTKPAALLVYNVGGAIGPDGFYYWNGSQWLLLAASTGSGFVENRTVNNNFGTGQAASFDITGNGEIGGTLEVQGSVGINTTTPNASAILDIASNSKGMLIPRMTFAQRNAIPSPANSLIIFNTTSDCLEIYADGAWQSFYCSCPVLDPLQPILGPDPVCSGSTVSFSVPGVTGAATYTWTVSGVSSGNITGNGSTSISFPAPSSNTFNVSVVAANACANSTSTQSTTVNAYTAVPQTPTANAAPSSLCQGGNYTYSVVNGLGTNGLGVIDYTWTVTVTGSTSATLTANSQIATAGSPVVFTGTATAVTINVGSSDSGNVTVSVRGNNTCGSSSTPLSWTLPVNILPSDPTSASASVSTICAGQSTNLTLNGGGGGTNQVINWYTSSCGGTLVGTGNNFSVSPTATTTYYGRYEVPAPCNMVTSCQAVTVTVNQSSVAPTSISTTGGAVCLGTPQILTAVGGTLGTGANYQWGTGTVVGSNVIAGQTGITLTVSPTVTTSYWVRIVNTSSPCTAATAGVTTTLPINQPSVAPTNITGTTPLCSGTSTILTAVGGTLGTGANYQWGTGAVVGSNILAGQTNATLSVSPTVTTSYWVRIVNTTSPCPSTTAGVTLTITVNQPSVAPTSITGTSTICNGSSTTLTATGGTLGTGANYQWGTGSVVGTNPLVGQTGITLSVSPTTNTTYWVRIENGSSPCTATTAGATRLVTVNSLSTEPTGVSGTTTICSGSNTTLTVSGGSLGSGAGAQWFTGSCGGPSAGSGNSITVAPTSSTTYYVRYSGTCNTTACTTVNVTVNSLSTAPTSITGNTSICEDESTTLTLSGGSLGTGASAQWFTGSCGGTSAGTGTSITVSPNTTTTYYVRYTGTCNTTACASVAVNVTQIPADPGFASNGWNVYAYSGGDISLNGSPKGYYTQSGVTTYDTRSYWNDGSTPSQASGWVGCPVPIDYHNVVAKRQGFTCGTYSIDVTNHDDWARLYVNGSQVWEHNGCCDSHNAVWTGLLNASSTVEMRHNEGVGGSHQGLRFNLLSGNSTAPTGITGNLNITVGSSTTLTLSGGAAGSGAVARWYTGSCGGTLVGTGNSITVTPGSTTQYWVRYEGDCNTTGCATATVTVSTSCTHSITLYDSYGDGWHGNNFANVYVNGNFIGSYTLASGSGPATYNFAAQTGDAIQVTFTPGSWPEECYYTVRGPNITLISNFFPTDPVYCYDSWYGWYVCGYNSLTWNGPGNCN